MARKRHPLRKTLLIVGEGDSEAAFLKHLRDLYCSGGAGVAVTVRNAHGKGPEVLTEQYPAFRKRRFCVHQMSTTTVKTL